MCLLCFFSMEALFEQCNRKLQMNSLLHPNGQCVLWTGCINKHGYGQFRYRDPRDEATAGHRTRTAHRVALLVLYKDFDVAPSQQASHLCNNKLCINVNHLVFEGNSSNNMRKTCFSISRCCGHYDMIGSALPDCLVNLQE